MSSDSFIPGPISEIKFRVRSGRPPKIVVRKKKTRAGQPERYVFVIVNLENVGAGDRILLHASAFPKNLSGNSGAITTSISVSLKPFALNLSFSLLALTDAGCGELSRYRRPCGTRPNLDDLIEIWREKRATAGNRFLGLEIKNTSCTDVFEILLALAQRLL